MVFWLFKKKGEENRWHALNFNLKIAFSQVKDDIKRLTEWTRFFYAKSKEYDIKIKELDDRLRLQESSKEHIKLLANQDYNYQALLKRIEQLETNLKEQERVIKAIQAPVIEKNFGKPSIELKNRSYQKTGLKEKIFKKISRKSNQYIKTTIISLIQKYEQISALQLREIVVDEQRLCSKSTFYRILEEIEAEGMVSTVRKGKEKKYIAKGVEIKILNQ